MKKQPTFELNQDIYDRNMRWCKTAANYLGLDIKSTEKVPDTIKNGHIFVFNHFTRFETAIPPYLIYRETGQYCRSVAAYRLFEGHTGLRDFIIDMGAVPNRYPGLLPYLAAEILRGRKIIIFPEGGLVKDKQVLGEDGSFRIFSGKDQTFRKQHRGAAVLALVLDLFKHRILDRYEHNDQTRLEHWRKSLGLNSIEELIEKAQEPTLIVPATITFFPLRITDNILNKGLKLINRKTPKSILEEMTVEGNMLFKPTDMDVYFGDPITAHKRLSWMEKVLLNRYFLSIHSLDDLFRLRSNASTWSERFLEQMITKETRQIRDEYMAAMYQGTTININHLAASLLVILAEQGQKSITQEVLQTTIYLALKNLHDTPGVNLHRSLTNPADYQHLLGGTSAKLQKFIQIALKTKILKQEDAHTYLFTKKLLKAHDRLTIRTTNPIMVIANEVAPLEVVHTALMDALKRTPRISQKNLATEQFTDEELAYAHDFAQYIEPGQEPAIAVQHGKPYLYTPKKKAKVGVLLIHGLLSSPGELKEFGKELKEAGYTVLGMRLPGHGTHLKDLASRCHQEWQAAVQRNYTILAAQVEHVVVVGFSTGGTLGLHLAAGQPKKLLGVAAIAAPMGVRHPLAFLTPLMVKVNKLSKRLTGKALKPYYDDGKTSPATNYPLNPMEAIRELRHTYHDTAAVLSQVTVPTLVIQGKEDSIIAPYSAQKIKRGLTHTKPIFHLLDTKEHRLITKDILGTRQYIQDFIQHVIKERVNGK